MATIVQNDQKILLQLSATTTNLSLAMTQLYTSVIKYLEIDERKAEKSYYTSMIAAYSQKDEESENLAETFMSLSQEADELTSRFKDDYYE